MSTNNVDNLTNCKINEILRYTKGLVDGIRDVLKQDDADFKLEDYWYAWDNTIDINVMYDPEKYKHIVCLYPVYNMIRDDSTFQRFVLEERI